MKVLIVFLGLFVIQASFVSYQGDMTRYMARQAELKFMAEEDFFMNGITKKIKIINSKNNRFTI